MKEKTKKNSSKKTDLMTLEGGLPVGVTEEEFKKACVEDMARTVEGVIPELPLIKILHAGALAFNIPSDKSEEGKLVQSFIGIIIDQHNTNAFWEKSFKETGGGVPPDCHSPDGICGVNTETGEIIKCATCSKNLFTPMEDDDGEKVSRKPCKNMKRLFVMLPSDELPSSLILSPKNIKPADKFFSVLMKMGTPMTWWRVEFSLKKATSRKGIEYSEISFKPIEKITTEEYWKNKMFLDAHMEQIRGQKIEYDTVTNGNDGEETSEKTIDEVKEELFP